MIEIKNYGAYNHRRYSTPWVGAVSKETAKIDFSKDVGKYTGYKGESGTLYLYSEPKIGDVFAYGQKDYKGNNTEINYIKYFGEGKFQDIEKTDLIKSIS